MKIYTKTGDTGETSLIGGKRVKKNCVEIDAIGEVDELNAHIGLLAALLTYTTNEEEIFHDAKKQLEDIQHALFIIGANIAATQTNSISVPILNQQKTKKLEEWIDQMERSLPKLTQFILPKGSVGAACAFLSRAVCRRAERRIVELKKKQSTLDQTIVRYLNRLSDYLFVLGRTINAREKQKEICWKK